MRRRFGPIQSSIAIVALLGAAIVMGGRARASGVPTQPMDAHMEVTLRTAPAADDRARAAAIVAAARSVMAKYPSVEAAQAAGFEKFAPGIALPIEHYTSKAFALESWFGHFDPMHPTSLIFKRSGETLTLVGVMYTASNRSSAADLNARVPLSIGTWHRHVDICMPPAGTPRQESLGPEALFGFAGSISTDAACRAAGGRFKPVVFGWMIHVWPNESDPARIWAVDPDGSMHHGEGMTEHHEHVAYNGLPIALDRLPAQTVAAGDAAHGAAVFAADCAACHGAAGRNGDDAPQLAGMGLSAGQVGYMVRHPKDIDTTSEMPLLPLSDRDLADVAAYVSTLK